VQVYSPDFDDGREGLVIENCTAHVANYALYLDSTGVLPQVSIYNTTIYTRTPGSTKYLLSAADRDEAATVTMYINDLKTFKDDGTIINLADDAGTNVTINRAELECLPNISRLVTSGTAAPTTGTWSKGDLCWNSAPSVGAAMGWVCVTAGTPGTWAAFGNAALTGSVVWNPGSLADGAGETSAAITVTGAALGDYAIAAAPYDLQGITCNAYVSATNAAKIRLQNETTGTIDLASGTWTVRVIKA
jgi:hypothetical protein